MLKLEFKEGGVHTRSGVKNDKEWTIHEQEAWLTRKQPNGSPSPYPEKVIFLIDSPDKHYEFGVFDWDLEKSLYIGDFNSPRLGRPALTKLQPQAVKAAA